MTLSPMLNVDFGCRESCLDLRLSCDWVVKFVYLNELSFFVFVEGFRDVGYPIH